jgi:hypothetical protein
MQGPRRTRREVIATLRHEVEKLMSVGAERSAAIQMIARKHGVPATHVLTLISPEPLAGGEA